MYVAKKFPSLLFGSSGCDFTVLSTKA